MPVSTSFYLVCVLEKANVKGLICSSHLDVVMRKHHSFLYILLRKWEAGAEVYFNIHGKVYSKQCIRQKLNYSDKLESQHLI